MGIPHHELKAFLTVSYAAVPSAELLLSRWLSVGDLAFHFSYHSMTACQTVCPTPRSAVFNFSFFGNFFLSCKADSKY